MTRKEELLLKKQDLLDRKKELTVKLSELKAKDSYDYQHLNSVDRTQREINGLQSQLSSLVVQISKENEVNNNVK